MQIGSYILEKNTPAIMGIVNVTPDSFSDGGKCFDAGAAISHALTLEAEGADIIDIGGESTRPGAEAISQEEEITRVIPVIQGIRKSSKIPISIDTTKSHVALTAVKAGADMINDISAGKFDPEILEVAAKTKVALCLMHMQGVPRTMQVSPSYKDLIGEVKLFLSNAAQDAISKGVDKNKIMIDPGIGFGKSVDDNLNLIKNLREFTSLGFPILIGTSRKSFIGKLLGLETGERDEATLATLAAAMSNGASVLRVHNVKAAKRFVDMYVCLQSAPT